MGKFIFPFFLFFRSSVSSVHPFFFHRQPHAGTYRLRVLCFTVCVLECQTEQLSFIVWLLGLLQCYGFGEVGDGLDGVVRSGR